MLVEIEPPLVGQLFGLGDRDLSQLIFSSRYEGYALYPITKWPCPVYVSRVLDAVILQTLSFSKEQVELIAWPTIFRTRQEADAHVRKLDHDAAI